MYFQKITKYSHLILKFWICIQYSNHRKENEVEIAKIIFVKFNNELSSRFHRKKRGKKEVKRNPVKIGMACLKFACHIDNIYFAKEKNHHSWFAGVVLSTNIQIICESVCQTTVLKVDSRLQFTNSLQIAEFGVVHLSTSSYNEFITYTILFPRWYLQQINKACVVHIDRIL